MLSFLVIVFLVVSVQVEAQITYDIFTGSFVCPPAAGIGSFCLAKSMVSSLIIHCNDQKGTEENCNDSLSGVPPVGRKLTAACYESSPSSGKAACSFQGIVYLDAGEPYPITTTATSLLASPSSTSTSSASSTSSTSSTPVSISSTLSTSQSSTPSLNNARTSASSGRSGSASMVTNAITSNYVPWSGKIGMGTLTMTTTATWTGGAGPLMTSGFGAGAVAWGMVAVMV